ncbi:DNA polymerase III subunit alpha [Candidatus Cardinium hertigii]|uniref:DNA polymerase III subunit alpha n=1 Tax=Candidatus Cardinium hertigii TaxID=247481 RepID=A0A3N2QDS3_9BACT|nr:DNA polymerase III subunit alpha [Candidatus Cardinium hertigii]ROT47820.1 DNA polymerase III subunit alpha [Candidatus Cardinium hertigii]ROT47822.1 DNA polymerase III subunit alpha [Candidatus Cardinium hertigii]
MHDFCHLHCHTEYSLLDGAAKVKSLVAATKQLGMQALAITDHGNMFGVPHFVAAAAKEKVKPIIGCEMYMAPNRHDHKDKTRYHQLLLAKNAIGYQNLIKLCSLGFLEGYYYKPRIDKALLKQYKEGLIATTCCLGAEIPRAIIQYGEAAAEKLFLEWLDLFGEDYYIEIQRHNIKEQNICNPVLLHWAKKYDVKIIATNDVHYITKQDSVAQDVLLCLQTGQDYHDPNRMRFSNDQFFLKSPVEMALLFADIPAAITNTIALVERIETPCLARDILLPIFSLPDGFTDPNLYLKHLTFSGARSKYGTISVEVESRLNYELATIMQTNFASYFLIVQDFIDAATRLGVIVGPGRGSIAGSLVAFCIGITKVDPLRYNLLFERFLNPERVSMPDIDVDFDDEGRKKVIDYVVEKYGKSQVASIITFGSMAAKSAIRDVARVLGMPLARANYIAKRIPDKLGITLAEAFEEVAELAAIKKAITTSEGQVLALAETLEGVVRHTGIHAAGMIIAPDDLLNYIPVKTDKNSGLLVTQYDGAVLEQMGMLKMDFLGLKTLSIIKDALLLIEQNRGISIDIDLIPLDDPITFKLYQTGNTKGTFQFESEGMRQWLIKLQPTTMEELIAMNSLYRPGPMQFIPNFIARKHGIEPIEYPHPLLEDILKSTYGIMIYQEQIIQTAQHMAGYTLGGADLLRRAMGKKKTAEMAMQRDIFVAGAAKEHNISKEKALAVFDIMEKFAQYGFNRSHSAAYSLIAYQTAYLKANYPTEYMAAVLTHNQGDIEKISFFMEESRQQGIAILGPDINESQINFSANLHKEIRVGLGAIKGTGDAAVTAIIQTRKAQGPFKDIYDFVESIDLKAVGKKTIECLALSGAFDSFKGTHRKQYVYEAVGGSFVEKIIQYGNHIKKERIEIGQSLFAASAYSQIKKPEPVGCAPYEPLEQLRIEKELVGFYISGHPLDAFKIDMASFCNVTTKNILTSIRKVVSIAGILTACIIKQDSKGNAFALLTLADYHGSLTFALFGEDYLKHKHLLETDQLLFLTGNISTRYRNQDIQVFKPQTISLLRDIRPKMTKGIHLKLAQRHINTQLVNALESGLKRYPGKYLVKISIVDHEEQMAIPTLSQQYRVQLNNELFVLCNKLSIDFLLCS